MLRRCSVVRRRLALRGAVEEEGGGEALAPSRGDGRREASREGERTEAKDPSVNPFPTRAYRAEEGRNLQQQGTPTPATTARYASSIQPLLRAPDPS